MKNKKYLQQKNSPKVLVPQTTADIMSMVTKSFTFTGTCKFPMEMHLLPTRRWPVPVRVAKNRVQEINILF